MKFFIKKAYKKGKNTEKRVYCLYRVPTKGQVDKDDIPMQRLKCNEFAKA